MLCRNWIRQRGSWDAYAIFENVLMLAASEEHTPATIAAMMAQRAFSLKTHLTRAFIEGDVQYLSWAGRSLLELKFFAAFATSSDEKMARFKKDAFVDASTALNVSSKHVKNITDVSQKEESEKMLLWVENRIGPVLDTEGVTHKDGFLAPSQIAKEFDGAQEFGIVNMLFSKFAHTTAMSTVLPFETETHMSHVRALLLQVGAMNAIAVIDILMEYMAKKNVAGFAN
jgi:hypothetical protein